MSKHTPGPWAIDWNVLRLDVFSSDARTLVASLRRSAMSPGIDEAARANARLIAAAPDMLSALHEADETLEKDGYAVDGPTRTLIRAAIAKATLGGQA